MKNSLSVFPRTVTAVAYLAIVLTLATPATCVERHTLPGHVPEAVARLNLQPLGRLPTTNRLHLAIGLPLRNTNELSRLLQDVYDPASPRFRRYLTPEQFTERFGPTKQDYDAVRQYAEAHGLEIVHQHENRVVLSVAGQVSDIERAFHVRLCTYAHPKEARQFYAPDVEPSVEASLPVLDMSGLDNYAIPHPLYHLNPHPGRGYPGAGSGPDGLYMGRDFRNAYVPGVTLTGTGQMVGLVAFAGYPASDVATYENLAGLPHVPVQLILLDGFNGVPVFDGTGAGEVTLDIVMALSMAPGLAGIVVFDAGHTGLWNDVLAAMADNPQIKQLSSSWGGSPNVTSDQLFQQIALQGQSFFVASGDEDSLSAVPFWPSDGPYLTSVGGTTLTMSGSGLAYVSETVWNWGYNPPGWGNTGYAGSTGGHSLLYPIPSWQQGLDMSANGGSTTMRNFPDVAMVADNVLLVKNGSDNNVGGTSCAAPLWAGFTALVNQAATANGDPPVGFLNPALYKIGQSSNYTNCFHDITVGNDATGYTPTQFPAVPGYDLCTGWGSPTGSNLIYALAFPEPLRIIPNSGLSFAGPVGGPFSPEELTFTVADRAASLDWTLAQDVAWLYFSATSGTLAGGGSATNLSVMPNMLASNLAAGSYTATLFFTNLNDQSVQARQATLAIVAPPLITSQPSNQALLQGMTTTFTVGTAPNALLSYQWQFDNGVYVTNLSDGGNLSGSVSSTLTVGKVSPADAGAYSVVISNAAGSILSADATLTVLTGQAPVIVSQPASQTLLPGATATFTVGAAGDPPLAYSWQIGGTNLTDSGSISGSSSNTLRLANATAVNAGTYSVLITNGFGSTTSVVAVLKLTGVASSGVNLEALHSFTTNGDGFNPYGGLCQASDGNFYGTASSGSPQGWGAVFRMTTNWVISVLHAFSNGTDGSIPGGALIQGTNGLLYGTASSGGSSGDGAVFGFATNGQVAGYSLTSASSGSAPQAAMAQGRDGNFYGTATTGGADLYDNPFGYGTVFKLTPGGAVTGLASFNSANGANPASTLVQAPDGSLYGTAQNGGTNGGWGTIFIITPTGTLNALFSFANTNGADPVAGLTLDAGGDFYGTTYTGGLHNAGTVFKLSAAGTFTSLYSFTGGLDGSNCRAGLLLASDGNFYGATESGGAYGLGTVFRMAPDGALITLAHFDGYQGANPEATLIQGTDGALYGTTYNGGAFGYGAVFRLSIDSPLEITWQPQPQTAFAGDNVTFSVATFGSLPVSYQWRKDETNLVDGANLVGANARVLMLTNVDVPDAANYSVVVSNTYGSVTSAVARLEVVLSPPYIVSGPEDQTALVGSTVTLSVEAGGDGELAFQWQENGTNLVDGGNISGSATATLTLAAVTAADARTYSVIVSNAIGSVSSAPAALTVLPVTSPSASLVSLHSFSGGTNGFNPYGGLVQGADGNLYGTTLNGGTELFGAAFRLLLGGGFSVLHSFTNGPDGANPYAGLVQASPNTFYGATFDGVTALDGTLFKLASNGAFTPLYSFGGGDDGANPLAALIQGSDGKLYGTASAGGTNGLGTVFSLTTNGLFTPLWSFHSDDGSQPVGPLVAGRDGKLYGLTCTGGAHDLGTVFSLTTNGMLNSLVSFDYVLGAYPSNGLVQASDGAFYGTASQGGTNGGWGTVFRVTADGTLTMLHSFNWLDGAYPTGGLLQGTDGNLYGTTSQGGIGGEGTVFQITPNGVLTTLVWFNGANGASPQSSLIQARNGSLYGTAEFGGSEYTGAPGSGDGLVFRLILPLFLSQTLTQASAIVGQPYTASLANNAVSPPGDTLTFAKVSGPAWLNVAPDGTLSGTPAVPDIGASAFTVSLADTYGWASTATLNIAVMPSPVITAVITSQGTNLVFSWGGRLPPYQVQMATNLVSPAWQDLGGPMTNTTLLLAPTNAAAFYRIQGQ